MPEVFINFISKDPEIRTMGVEGIKRFMLMMPVIGTQIISANFFQAIGKAQKSFILSMLRQVILLIPLILILPNFFGLMGIWTAVPIADFIATAVTAVVLIAEMKNLHRDELQYREERKDQIEENVEKKLGASL